VDLVTRRRPKYLYYLHKLVQTAFPLKERLTQK
jgi:hypothetical protein